LNSEGWIDQKPLRFTRMHHHAPYNRTAASLFSVSRPAISRPLKIIGYYRPYTPCPMEYCAI